MLDYGALPPEINSGRIYTGPGSGPLMAAASAWDSVAAELGTAATGYDSAICRADEFAVVGSGIAGDDGCGDAVCELEISAAAYRAGRGDGESGPAPQRPPARPHSTLTGAPAVVIAANRVLLATLVATNFFGQNTPAISRPPSGPVFIWRCGASRRRAAMYGYAGSSGAGHRA